MPSEFILREVLDNTRNATVSLTSAKLHVRKQQIMSSLASAIEKLRAIGNNIKLLVPHTIMNQRHIATHTRTYTDSLIINDEIPSKIALAFVKRASALESWTNSPKKFRIFGISFLVCEVNEISLHNLCFDKSDGTLYELTMQSLK